MDTITSAVADGFSIGKLSQLTGVNIETIRYYEKIEVLPLPVRADAACTVRRSGAFSLLCDAHVSWVFHLTRSARCSGSAATKPRAAKCERLPLVTSTTSAPRSAISASWNAC